MDCICIVSVVFDLYDCTIKLRCCVRFIPMSIVKINLQSTKAMPTLKMPVRSAKPITILKIRIHFANHQLIKTTSKDFCSKGYIWIVWSNFKLCRLWLGCVDYKLIALILFWCCNRDWIVLIVHWLCRLHINCVKRLWIV